MTCFEGKKQVHIRIIISSIKANSYKKKSGKYQITILCLG